MRRIKMTIIRIWKMFTTPKVHTEDLFRINSSLVIDLATGEEVTDE